MFNAGVELIGGFFGGIIDFLLNNPIVQFFGGIIDGIKEFLGIGDDGGSTVTNEIGANTAQGYVDGVNSVDGTAAGAQLSEETMAGIASGAGQGADIAAAGMVDDFTTGVSNNTDVASTAGEEIGEAVGEGASSVDLSDSALQTIRGYANGLTSNSGIAEEAMKRVVNNVKRTANETLEIESPSRVMMETGKYTAQGLALGLLNNIATVAKASSALGQASNNSLSNALSNWDSYGIDFDSAPTIRPVLDLTDVYAGIMQMRTLIGNEQIGGFATIGYSGNRDRNVLANGGNITYQLVLDGAVYNDIPEIENVVGNAFEIMGRYRGMNHG